MTIEEALINEIQKIYPDMSMFEDEAELDECPPYGVVSLVTGAPAFPAGETGTWQITLAHRDKAELKAMSKEIIKLFHGMYGDIGGMLVGSIRCIRNYKISPKDDAGIMYKAQDFQIYYR